MFLTLVTELEKLFRQKRTWMTLALLNVVSLGLLLTVLLLPVVTGIDPEVRDAMQQAVFSRPGWVRSALSWLAVLWANTFSMASTLFLALLAGTMVAGEFEDDSIQMYMVAPVSRVSVWMGKVLAAYGVYLLAWGLGLCLMAATTLRACALQPGLAELVPREGLLQVLGAYALVDLATLSFFLLVSTWVRGGTSATLTGLGLYLLSMVGDFFLWLFREFDALPEMLAQAMDYSFTRTSRVLSLGEVSAFLRNPLREGGFPVELDLLGANLAWMLAFLVLGTWCFARRESRPEST